MVRSDPWAWMAEETPALLAHLAAERAWYETSCAHLRYLVSTLRAEMGSRVSPTERSASWARHRFSYYTSHPAGSDYGQLLREHRNDLGASASVFEGEPASRRRKQQISGASARRRKLRRRQRLPRPRGEHREPGRGRPRLLRRHDRRRGVRPPVPRPAHRPGPRRGGRPELLRRRVERGLGLLLLRGPRRGLPALRGLAAPARHPGERGRPRAHRDRRAIRAQPAREPQRGRDPHLEREPGHQRMLAGRRAGHPRRHPSRSAVAGRAWSTAPSTSARRPGRVACCW